MAGKKGTGKGRGRAKALPTKMITVYGEILQETELAILVRCDKEADGAWLPKSKIEYKGERGDIGVQIQIPELLANEKGFFDGQGFKQDEAPAPAAAPAKTCQTCLHHTKKPDGEVDPCIACMEADSADSPPNWTADPAATAAPPDDEEGEEDSAPADKRTFGENVKWIKEETITVSTPLSEKEKAKYAEEMAALDAEIIALEIERADISSRLKKQIDAKEEERREMSKAVNEGEARTYTCDCLKDYNTKEMVWTAAYPPYNEVDRRPMTKEEQQPSLLEFSEKVDDVPFTDSGTAGQDFDTLAEQGAAEQERTCATCGHSNEEGCNSPDYESCEDDGQGNMSGWEAKEQEPERTCNTCHHNLSDDGGVACGNPEPCEGEGDGNTGWKARTEEEAMPPVADETPGAQPSA